MHAHMHKHAHQLGTRTRDTSIFMLHVFRLLFRCRRCACTHVFHGFDQQVSRYFEGAICVFVAEELDLYRWCAGLWVIVSQLMYIYMCVFVCVYIYYTYIRICICIHMHICMSMYICVWVSVQTEGSCTSVLALPTTEPLFCVCMSKPPSRSLLWAYAGTYICQGMHAHLHKHAHQLNCPSDHIQVTSARYSGSEWRSCAWYRNSYAAYLSFAVTLSYVCMHTFFLE